MQYSLRNGVSYCRVDDYVVFLDVDHDRYFRLPTTLEHAFLAQIDGKECPKNDIERLVDSGVLTHLPSTSGHMSSWSFEDPSSSALEQAPTVGKLTPGALLETASTVLLTRWQLRTRTLRHVLATMLSFRDRYTTPTASEAIPVVRQRLASVSAVFRRARLYVPIDTSCLLDSVAMVKFLARQGLYAHVVFGIASDPFSAHCWVQAEGLVLNDTIGNVKLHTPILVV